MSQSPTIFVNYTSFVAGAKVFRCGCEGFPLQVRGFFVAGARVFRCGCEGFSLQVRGFFVAGVRVFRCKSSFFCRPATLIGLLDKKPSRVSDFLGTCDAWTLYQRHFSPSPATPVLGGRDALPGDSIPRFALHSGSLCYPRAGVHKPPERHPFLRGKCAWRGVMAFPAQYIISGPARGRFCCKWMKGLECEDGANQKLFGRQFASPVYDTTTTDEHAIGHGGSIEFCRTPVVGGGALQSSTSGGADSRIQAGVASFIATVGLEHIRPVILAEAARSCQ